MTQDQHLERVARARRSQQDAHGEWVEAVLEAHRAGLSYRRIAEAAGVTHPAIQQIVKPKPRARAKVSR